MSHKRSLLGTKPQYSNQFGSKTSINKSHFPILDRLSLYRLVINEGCFREPHWHPETAELGYVHTGSARMTVQSPDESAETYELSEGDIYFIPRAYPHHIENLTEGELRFLIFFDTPDVQDIGLTGAIPSFRDRLVAPTLGLTEEQVARIPRAPSDLLLVSKTNPIEA